MENESEVGSNGGGIKWGLALSFLIVPLGVGLAYSRKEWNYLRNGSIVMLVICGLMTLAPGAGIETTKEDTVVDKEHTFIPTTREVDTGIRIGGQKVTHQERDVVVVTTENERTITRDMTEDEITQEKESMRMGGVLGILCAIVGLVLWFKNKD